MTQQETAYDAIPYDSHPFPQSHPDRLAAIARLFGLVTPAVETCRVLELGCSTGGNLIAMAQKFPAGRFVGLDLSSRQIASGWQAIDALGLRNVELRQMDITDLPESLGEFDYIVCHGVYSWVPPLVQEKILSTCKRHLAGNGVAYISYNTFPGWHIRGIVRDMMMYRGTHFSDDATRLAQAKSLVEFVAMSAHGSEDPYRKLLQDELGVLSRSDDYYLHHDHLEENNHPVYFHEFARRLGVNGLQYLGEAEFYTMVSTNFAPEIAAKLQELGAHDIVQMEQYMDFVRCRYFRQTLVCHGAVRLNRQLSPGMVRGFQLATPATPEAPEDSAAPDAQQTFRTPGGRGITCRSPLTKEALRRLRESWPASISFTELSGRLPDSIGKDDALATEMLACIAAGVVEWRIAADPFTTVVAPRPQSSPIARRQAASGKAVTNLRGERVTLDELHRTVLRHLDGELDFAGLVETIDRFVSEGGHQLRRDGDNQVVVDRAERLALLETALDKVLQQLAQKALLLR